MIFLLVTWWLLLKMLPPEIDEIPGGKELIRGELQALGSISPEERRVLYVFTLVSLIWTIRSFLLKPIMSAVDGTVIAVDGGVALFLTPAKGKRGQFLLDVEAISRISWEILILFGGGFAVASAFQTRGLARWMADQLTGLKSFGLFGLVVAVCTLMIFLTEVTSNTAIATLFMPIMASMGTVLGVSTVGLKVIAAGATPPNAIVYSTGYLTIPQMARGACGSN